MKNITITVKTSTGFQPKPLYDKNIKNGLEFAVKECGKIMSIRTMINAENVTTITGITDCGYLEIVGVLGTPEFQSILVKMAIDEEEEE